MVGGDGFTLACFLLIAMAEFVQSQDEQNTTMPPEEEEEFETTEAPFVDESEVEARPVTTLWNTDYTKWPKCTRKKFLAEYPCGFDVPNQRRKMKTTHYINVCFYHSSRSTNYSQHLKLCKELGHHTTPFCPKPGNLFKAAIELFPKKDSYFIDYIDPGHNNRWRCSSGLTGNGRYWAKGKPDFTPNQYCSFQYKPTKGYLNDIQCSSSYPFVCLYHYEEHYKKRAFVAKYPKEVDLGGKAVITCKGRTALHYHSGLYLQGKIDLVTLTYKRGRPIPTSGNVKTTWVDPVLDNIGKDEAFYYEGTAVCLRDILHLYHFTDINWGFVDFKWKCCSGHGCSGEFSVGIKVYPQEPQLNVTWPTDTPGKLFSGDYLVATCTAYIGGFSPAALRWKLKTKRKTYTWRVHPEIETRNLLDGVELFQWPFRKLCPQKDDLNYRENGACYRLGTERIFERASQFCQSIDGQNEKEKWTLLNMKSDVSVFDFLKDYLIEGKRYWVGLTDKIKEGEFVWPDGTKTIKSDWGYVWREDEKTKEEQDDSDCAFIDKKGLHVHQPCENVVLDVICSSSDRFTPSKLDFPTGINDGPSHTSTVRIKHRQSMNGAKLSCYSYTGSNGKVLSHIAKNGSSAVAHAPKLTFDWGIPVPELEVTIDRVRGNVTARCNAHLGNAETMTWNIQTKAGSVKKWIISTNGTVEKGDEKVDVNVVKVTKSGDIGNDISSELQFDGTGEYKGAKIKCIPYDQESGRLDSLLSHEDDVIAVYPPQRKQKARDKSGPLAKTLVPILMLVMLVAGALSVLLVKKEDGLSSAGKLSEEQGSKVNHE